MEPKIPLPWKAWPLGDITGPDHQRVTDVYPPHHAIRSWWRYLRSWLNAGEFFESVAEASRSPGWPILTPIARCEIKVLLRELGELPPPE